MFLEKFTNITSIKGNDGIMSNKVVADKTIEKLESLLPFLDIQTMNMIGKQRLGTMNGGQWSHRGALG